MLLPTRKLVLLALLPAVALLAWPTHTLVVVTAAYDLVLMLVVLLDLRASTNASQLTITRRLPDHLSLNADNHVGWELHNASDQIVRFSITDDVPDSMRAHGLPVRGRIREQSRAELLYTVRPTRRGLYEFGHVTMRWETQLGLVQRQHRFAAGESAKVYPNVANLRRYEMAAQRNRLAQLGMVAMKHRGAGSIFESLREYVPGDDPTDIAWKASARRNRLITRNFEADRSQNVLAVIDCGRLMCTEIDGLTRLDYAINTTILLSYVAVKQGDYIGMLAFSNDIQSYVPPISGYRAVSRMNEALYTLEPSLREANYEQACRFLALQHRKRSLIIIFTDVVDAEASSALLSYMTRFARTHLPVCVTMRNLDVESIAYSRPETPEACYQQAVALQVIDRRAKALARMRRAGVSVLDVDPRAMTPQLIERYLTIKQRTQL